MIKITIDLPNDGNHDVPLNIQPLNDVVHPTMENNDHFQTWFMVLKLVKVRVDFGWVQTESSWGFSQVGFICIYSFFPPLFLVVFVN